MPSPLLSLVEPALCHARETLKRGDARVVRRALTAAYAVLDIHRPPRYESYDPQSLLHDPALDAANTRCELASSALPECYGDPAQILHVARAAIDSAMLFDDTLLRIRLHADGDVPCVSLTFDGPGKFPDEFLFGGMVPLSFDVMNTRWTAATRGGRIDRTSQGLTLRLAGMKAVPESIVGFEDTLAPLRAALRLLEDSAASGEVSRAVDAMLQAIDADARAAEPGDLASLVSDVLSEAPAILDRANVRIESLCSDGLPPIVMRRQALRTALANVLRHAARTFPKGGGVALLVEYDASRRCAAISVSSEGNGHIVDDTYYLDTARRCVVDLHNGSWDYTEDARQAVLVCTLPDAVGCALDAWIPDWERFSDRARQMLRLLRSGGPTPPEAFVLEGVLEDELARWLLPRYESPAVVNIAHEITGATGGLPGLSPERLEKGLTQIRRGKPRKEMARPPYAAEMIWAFGNDARRRGALGTDRCDDNDLRALCTALLATPPDCATALRIIASRVR